MKIIAWFIGVFFLAHILLGSTVTWTYNGEKAKKTFWSKTLKVCDYVGDLKNAIFK